MKIGPRKEPRRALSSLAPFPLALLTVSIAAAAGCAPPGDGDVGVVRGAGFSGPPQLLVKPGTRTAHGEIFSCAMVQNVNKSGLKCWGYNGSGRPLMTRPSMLSKRLASSASATR